MSIAAHTVTGAATVIELGSLPHRLRDRRPTGAGGRPLPSGAATC